ncbi:hypothetical protein IMCC3317_18050 [Kordia antarctica]|uniref:Uncharacterized protein n=1 Tax=Kordia antarctica TaxID=1218801 RepID=A0A7L4ZIH7_9FLAO|nr:hypothetical protein [Kordia antarctica]QHI36442.1 hypothetical protein IMCC3317_18050 [Kordia antarctica]
MLKNILEVKGAEELSKKTQSQINGGGGESCWDVCPRQAAAICDPNTVGIYECDCNCP